MAIINRAHAGSQINLLCMIYRVIFRNNGKLSLDEISNLCRPERLPASPNAKKRFGENLRFWMRDAHQLWKENDQSKLELTKLLSDDSPQSIAVATNQALFSPKIKNIFGKDSHDTEGLFRLLGCILASEQYLFDSGKELDTRNLGRLISECLPDYIPNDSEKIIVLQYGHLLGFLETGPSGGYIVDPTRVVKTALDRIFSGVPPELEARVFFDRLEELVPLIDGGKYRKQIEKNMIKVEGEFSSDNQLSKSLSLALDRLRKSLLISFGVKGDDSNAYWLELPHGEEKISSVQYLAGADTQ